MKLSPIHRRLSEMEIKNIQDYFNSDLISPEQRRRLNSMSAFFLSYYHAICRLAKVTPQARQDYYALNRQCCFAVKELPSLQLQNTGITEKLPLLIVPGLNTPPVFFREMHGYFTQKGYPVQVMSLPDNGLSDVATSASKLGEELDRLVKQSPARQINIIGHCLGGVIAHYWLQNQAETFGESPVANLVSLGTGFMGAEGVQELKQLWIPRNPGKPVPRVFDELIHWNLNLVKQSTGVAYHSLLTVWDFMVHFRKGLLQAASDVPCKINNLILDDPAIDHLTIALHHSVFERIDHLLASTGPKKQTS